jgi:hypothetical protein
VAARSCPILPLGAAEATATRAVVIPEVMGGKAELTGDQGDLLTRTRIVLDRPNAQAIKIAEGIKTELMATGDVQDPENEHVKVLAQGHHLVKVEAVQKAVNIQTHRLDDTEDHYHLRMRSFVAVKVT